jgi:hypothetical protein
VRGRSMLAPKKGDCPTTEAQVPGW